MLFLACVLRRLELFVKLEAFSVNRMTSTGSFFFMVSCVFHRYHYYKEFEILECFKARWWKVCKN